MTRRCSRKRFAMKRSGHEVSLQWHDQHEWLLTTAELPTKVEKGERTFGETYLMSTTRSHVVTCIPGDISFNPLTFPSLYAGYPSYITFLFVCFICFWKVDTLQKMDFKMRCPGQTDPTRSQHYPTQSNIIQHSPIQHCWTMLHSVERGGQRISTLGIERSGYKI